MFRSRFLAAIAFVSLFAFAVPLSAFFQTSVAPRDPDKLMSRVNAYWEALKAGKRATASQFVVSQDRDTFLSPATLSSIGKQAQIVGWDFTTDRNAVIVRTRVQEISSDVPDGLERVNGDTWVWKDGNWFLTFSDASKSLESMFKMAGAEEIK